MRFLGLDQPHLRIRQIYGFCYSSSISESIPEPNNGFAWPLLLESLLSNLLRSSSSYFFITATESRVKMLFALYIFIYFWNHFYNAMTHYNNCSHSDCSYCGCPDYYCTICLCNRANSSPRSNEVHWWFIRFRRFKRIFCFHLIGSTRVCCCRVCIFNFLNTKIMIDVCFYLSFLKDQRT